MVEVESTPRMAMNLYAKMVRNLQIVRRRVGNSLTLSDKILLGHSDKPNNQGLEPGRSQLLLRPDRVVFQDALGQNGMLQFMQTKRDRVTVPTTIHCDHLIQARTDGPADLRASLNESSEVYDFLRSAAAKYGCGFWEPGAGIIHQVVLENYAFPGELIIGTDSHTPNAGGLGACAIGVGGADAVEVIAGLPWEILYPRHIAIYLSGELKGWTSPKDVILYVAGKLGVSGGTNAILEYIGPGARTISATGKATIANMGAELGATTSLFPFDQAMARYLCATNRAELLTVVERYQEMFAPDPEVEENPEKYYDIIITINLSTLEPHVVGPHTPDRARPISRLAAEITDGKNAFVDEISTALIGSCTNSSYEDMCRAADIAAQAIRHGINSAVSFLVTPGSEQIRATIERDGQMKVLQDFGATVLANACGPCVGQWQRGEENHQIPNTIVSSYNRNFPRRNDGQSTTMNFIASPEVVTALAIAGRLSFNPLNDSLTASDGTAFKLIEPRAAPDVPSANFDGRHTAYIPPPENGGDIVLKINPNSERLQLLEPWPAWDGNDFLDMPVLVKAAGQTTTDHISPAGPWLQYRGHLDKFSDNMFNGARNAFSDDVGTGLNAITNQRGQSFSDISRYYKAHGIKWVVVGDHNYGEGSSREHAALSPRFLGGVAVIARSFARIHESNLKKNGFLALKFKDPDDYNLLREDDRLDMVGLNHLAPNSMVQCRIHHSDGTTETLFLSHSFTESQLKWFRAGAALNVLC